MSNHIRIRRLARCFSILAVLALLGSTFSATANAGWRVRNGWRRGAWGVRRYYAPRVRTVAPRYVVPRRYVQPRAYQPYRFSPPPVINGAPNIPMPIMMDRTPPRRELDRALNA